MKNRILRSLCAIVAATMLLGAAAPAMAEDKKETVFVVADANGETDHIVVSERLYNPDGTLAEASLFARGFGYGYFPKEVQHRFKEGDMVEFLDNRSSKIRLAIVAKEPLQPSEWYGNIRVYDRYQCLPLGSDKYYSVASIRVMPPHLPVGELMKTEHEDYLAKAKSKGLIFNQEIQ